MKVVFLDIDGVLQPPGRQNRFEHIRNGDIIKLTEQLNYKVKDRGDFDYKEFIKEGDEYSYSRMCDIGAVYYDWDKKSVSLLKELLDRTGAKIVVSSDWREQGFEEVSALLAIHDLKKYVIGMTWTCGYSIYDRDYFRLNGQGGKFFNSKEVHDGFAEKFPTKEEGWSAPSIDSRAIEIREYLDRNPEITNYVAIDDRNLSRGLEGHFVRTKYKLEKDTFNTALEILLSADDGPYPWPLDRAPLQEWRKEWVTP